LFRAERLVVSAGVGGLDAETAGTASLVAGGGASLFVSTAEAAADELTAQLSASCQ
jgi:hypothetical protein